MRSVTVDLDAEEVSSVILSDRRHEDVIPEHFPARVVLVALERELRNGQRRHVSLPDTSPGIRRVG